MALITASARVRRDIPHEAGQWIEFRPLPLGEAESVNALGGLAGGVRMLQACILAWSYPEECTPENIALLDLDTGTWAIEVVGELSHIDAAAGEA